MNLPVNGTFFPHPLSTTQLFPRETAIKAADLQERVYAQFPKLKIVHFWEEEGYINQTDSNLTPEEQIEQAQRKIEAATKTYDVSFFAFPIRLHTCTATMEERISYHSLYFFHRDIGALITDSEQEDIKIAIDTSFSFAHERKFYKLNFKPNTLNGLFLHSSKKSIIWDVNSSDIKNLRTAKLSEDTILTHNGFIPKICSALTSKDSHILDLHQLSE